MKRPGANPGSVPQPAAAVLRYVLSAAALALVLDGLAEPAEPADFGRCVERLQSVARADGISPAVVDDVLGSVRYLDRVIELDRRQPEFVLPFARYYSARVTRERVTRGRELLKEHRALLKRVQTDTGVPAQYLVAFWGLETNFGSYFGNMRVPDSLATLACDERRAEYFTGELLAALRIIDAGDVPVERMAGSWAGAMGHVQFMPSVFLRFAVDADGDGRRDVWGSVADALASGGNFLQQLGWVPGLRWGREVRLPDGFDYSLAGRDQPLLLERWRELGVTTTSGADLPRLDLEAELVVPAGYRGPAFLTYRNFRVIMGWNRSVFYAIAVGRLADRIAGAGELWRSPPEQAPLPIDAVANLQRQLNALGYEAGDPDGIVGPATQGAVRRFQQARGLVADGFVDGPMLDAVAVAVAVESGKNR